MIGRYGLTDQLIVVSQIREMLMEEVLFVRERKRKLLVSARKRLEVFSWSKTLTKQYALACFAKYGLPIWFFFLQVLVTLLNLATAIQFESAYSLIELMNWHFSVSETVRNMKFLVHINDLGKRLIQLGAFELSLAFQNLCYCSVSLVDNTWKLSLWVFSLSHDLDWGGSVLPSVCTKLNITFHIWFCC